MAVATISNLRSFYRGDTRTYSLTFKDTAGDPIDISNKNLWFTMKAAAEDADSISLLQKVVTFPADVDSEAGLGSLVLTSVDTAITPGTYFYDMQLVDSTNSPPEVTTITSGKVKIMQDISVTDTVTP